VQRWLLTEGPIEVSVLTYGALIQSLVVPDRHGALADVVLGFADLEDYVGEHPYFGATIGRYANRIDRGQFLLDGTNYQLPVNNGPNCLHGGTIGFDRRVWEATDVTEAGSSGVRLELVSPDGDNGFPGTLSTSVTMTLRDATLRLAYEATTDAPTVVNLTNHSYFNLAGAGSGSVEDHELEIDARRYLPVTSDVIPTGELAEVVGTPFDFTSPVRLGKRLREGHEQLVRGQGYDHCFALERSGGEPISRAARVHDPSSGRVLEVWTDQPGVQLYTGNQLAATLVGKQQRVYRLTDAVCLETQHFPDSVNQPSFPSTVLRPGERFTSTTEMRFDNA
jgi:aldose 1-epimerase